MKKHAVLVGLGAFYGYYNTGYDTLYFVDNNLSVLADKLTAAGWIVYPPLSDKNMVSSPVLPDKATIRKYLQEKIDDLSPGDWLLFYYTGHGDRSSSAGPMYLVSFNKHLLNNGRPPASEFFTPEDYRDVVRAFSQASPGGHLVSILDCCFAFGLVTDFNAEKKFHTILAASSAEEEAPYTDNSLFFKALAESWDDPFDQMEEDIISAASQQEDWVCSIQIATTFSSTSL